MLSGALSHSSVRKEMPADRAGNAPNKIRNYVTELGRTTGNQRLMNLVGEAPDRRNEHSKRRGSPGRSRRPASGRRGGAQPTEHRVLDEVDALVPERDVLNPRHLDLERGDHEDEGHVQDGVAPDSHAFH